MKLLKLSSTVFRPLTDLTDKLSSRECGVIRHSVGFKSGRGVRIEVEDSQWTWRNRHSAIAWLISCWKRITCYRRSSFSTSYSTMAATIRPFASNNSSPIRLSFQPIRSLASTLFEVRSVHVYKCTNIHAYDLRRCRCLIFCFMIFIGLRIFICGLNCSAVCCLISFISIRFWSCFLMWDV